MDLKKKEKLIELLYSNLPVWAGDRDVKASLESYYKEKGIDFTVVNGLLTQKTSFVGLNEVYLCIFVSAIYNFTKDNKMNPQDWFEEDIISLEKTYFREKSKNNRTVVFTNVDKIKDNHYFSTLTSYLYASHLLDDGLAGYKFETQREGKIKIKVVLSGIQMLTMPDLDPENCAEITDKMLLGDFTSNAISLNHEFIGTESKLVYDPVNRTLTIPLREDERLWVIDGYHRLTQMSGIISKKPTFSGTTMVNIFNYTEEQANTFIRQEASGKKMSKEHLEVRSPEKLSTMIAKAINDKSKFNPLFKKFSEADKLVDLTLNNDEIKYTSIRTVAFALEGCFGIINSKSCDKNMITDLKDLLTDRLGEIISLQKKHFDKIVEDRAKCVATFNGMFMVYIAIIARLNDLGYSEENSKEDRNKFSKKLAEVIKSIDFSLTNPLWKKLGIVTNNNKMKADVMTSSNCLDIKEYVANVLIVKEETKSDKEGAQ